MLVQLLYNQCSRFVIANSFKVWPLRAYWENIPPPKLKHKKRFKLWGHLEHNYIADTKQTPYSWLLYNNTLNISGTLSQFKDIHSKLEFTICKQNTSMVVKSCILTISNRTRQLMQIARPQDTFCGLSNDSNKHKVTINKQHNSHINIINIKIMPFTHWHPTRWDRQGEQVLPKRNESDY
jgi:hypothetical protein